MTIEEKHVSHITIIISRAAAPTDEAHALQPRYEYAIPVPHSATPQDVAELVRKAYRRLEHHDED